MKQNINEIKRMQQLAGLINENQLNESEVKINTQKTIQAPEGKLIISCGVSGDGTATDVEGMNNDEIIKFYQANYNNALEALIAFSDANDYTIGDDEENIEEYSTLEMLGNNNDEYVNLFCFVDITEDNKDTNVGKWIEQNKPTIYITKL
jgi:hypothetical protein